MVVNTKKFAEKWKNLSVNYKNIGQAHRRPPTIPAKNATIRRIAIAVTTLTWMVNTGKKQVLTYKLYMLINFMKKHSE